MSEEPIRWLEDPGVAASLRTDLAHSATATVHGMDHSVGLASLRGAIAAQTGALAPTASSSSLGVKTVVGLLVIGGGLGLWKATAGDDARVADPIEVVDASEPELPAPALERAAIPHTAPIAPSAVVGPTDDGPPAEAIAAPTKRDEKIERKSTPREATAAVEPLPDETDPRPDDRYLQEATMVARARKSLSQDPSRTLELTRAIAREFPSGQLVEERRALEIRALAKLGRLAEAKERAALFLADHAKGPHAAAVRRAIAE